MSAYQIAWRASTKDISVQAKGDSLPGGYTKIGEYNHEDAQDALGKTDAHNHVLWHHIRDLLYKIGVQDMSRVTIGIDTDYIALIDFTVAPTTSTKTVGQTQQLTHTFNPTNATNKSLTYSSSNTARATVNDSGLVTAISAGTVTITATSEDGAIAYTHVMTVS